MRKYTTTFFEEFENCTFTALNCSLNQICIPFSFRWCLIIFFFFHFLVIISLDKQWNQKLYSYSIPSSSYRKFKKAGRCAVCTKINKGFFLLISKSTVIWDENFETQIKAFFSSILQECKIRKECGFAIWYSFWSNYYKVWSNLPGCGYDIMYHLGIFIITIKKNKRKGIIEVKLIHTFSTE